MTHVEDHEWLAMRWASVSLVVLEVCSFALEIFHTMLVSILCRDIVGNFGLETHNWEECRVFLVD